MLPPGKYQDTKYFQRKTVCVDYWDGDRNRDQHQELRHIHVSLIFPLKEKNMFLQRGRWSYIIRLAEHPFYDIS